MVIKITKISVRNILNSAGKEAFEVEMTTDDNFKAMSSSPSAIIPGRREVITNRNVSESDLNEMINEIYNSEIENQSDFDNILNSYMQSLGSNICLPFSLTFARIMAQIQNITLTQYISRIANYNCERKSPIPLINIFSVGLHAQKEKGSIQNIMIAVDIHPFSKAIQPITEIYLYIENELKKRGILKVLRFIKWDGCRKNDDR